MVCAVSMQVLFQCPVSTLGLTVRLTVIGGTTGGTCATQSIQGLEKVGSEQWSIVGDNTGWETKMGESMQHYSVTQGVCSVGFSTWDEHYVFREFVGDCQNLGVSLFGNR